MTGDACGGRLCVETVVCLPMTFNIYQVWRRGLLGPRPTHVYTLNGQESICRFLPTLPVVAGVSLLPTLTLTLSAPDS